MTVVDIFVLCFGFTFLVFAFVVLQSKVWDPSRDCEVPEMFELQLVCSFTM